MPPPRLRYSDFTSYSRLFSTYTGEFAQLAAFFSGDYSDPRQRGQVARQVADQYKHRPQLVDVLLAQADSYEADEHTLANIRKLLDPKSVAVVTGQQVGLFGGPLYTILKTITAIQLTSRLSRDTGRDVVPIFWLEGEDHDLDEVSTVKVFRGNDVASVHYSAADAAHEKKPVPVGRIRFDASIAETLSEFQELLPPTDFTEEVMDLLRECYQEGQTFQTAFARLMARLFAGTGLVFVTSDDPKLKQLAAPIFRKEIKEFEKSSKALHVSSQKLEDNFHVQVRTNPANLFLLTENGRLSVRVSEDGETFECGDRSYSQDELLALLEKSPELFSPNVVLRPIVQDTLLPTAAYVAGPGEIAYFAQYRSIYEWAGVPMPIIYPRAGITVLESKVQKVLNRLDLSIQDFEGSLDEMFHSNVLDGMDIDANAIFARASQHLHDAVNTVAPAIESVDASLVKAAGATRTALLKEWSRLQDRVIKAEKRRHDQTFQQMEKAQSNLFPDGSMQERVVSPFYFANKYGLDFVTRLLHEIQIDTSEHQVILM